MDELGAARLALASFTGTYRITVPPVDVTELAASLYRLRVRLGDDLAQVAGTATEPPLSGLLLPGEHEIWVRRDEPAARRRFTIAHEVGHHLLHSGAGRVLCRPADLAGAGAEQRAQERQANRFAAELLMPEPLVRAHADRDGPDPFALAAVFDVSEVAMGYRLVNLDYLETLPAVLERLRGDR